MARIKNKNCNPPVKYICTTQTQDESCEDRRLTASNTEHPIGYSDITTITPEVNQISAYKEHLEFVNSPKPLSGIKNHVVLRLAESFINTIANIFRGTNVGTGTDIYKGPRTVGTDTFHDFKRLKDSESINFQGDTNDIIAVVDQDWLEDQFPEIPVVDYPVIDGISVGTGTPLYKGLANKKINIASLYSDDFIITDFQDGVKISSPGGGSNSNDFYLDESFVRPIDWEARTNPEEILNTSISPIARKVASGRLNDPFKDYEEFLLKVIGPESGSNANGAYSRSNPRITGLLQILNSVGTTQALEVNNWALRLVNNAFVRYDGNLEYALDMRRLYTDDIIDSVTGMFKRTMSMDIRGQGVITRLTGYGLIYSKGDTLHTTATNNYYFVLRGELTGLRLYEPDNTGNARLTRADNTTPLSGGNTEIFGRVQTATTPLIVIDSSSFGFWGTLFEGNIFIKTNTQTHMKFVNQGALTQSGVLSAQVGNEVIGYKRKMIENAPGNTAEENAFLATKKEVGEPLGFFYEPQDDHIVFDIQDQSNFRFENLASEANRFLHGSANSLFRVGPGSILNNIISINDTGGFGAINMLTMQGVPDYILLTNFNLESSMHRLFKGTGSNNVNINLRNVILNQASTLKDDLGILNIDTGGTYCVLKGRPMISLEYQADNATAILAGYEKNMLYRNPTGDVAQVY